MSSPFNTYYICSELIFRWWIRDGSLMIPIWDNVSQNNLKLLTYVSLQESSPVVRTTVSTKSIARVGLKTASVRRTRASWKLTVEKAVTLVVSTVSTYILGFFSIPLPSVPSYFHPLDFQWLVYLNAVLPLCRCPNCKHEIKIIHGKFPLRYKMNYIYFNSSHFKSFSETYSLAKCLDLPL